MSTRRYESSSPCNGAPQGGPAVRREGITQLKGAATRRRKTTTKGETEGRGNKAAVDGDARERARWEK
jgi:hypothetical protein